MVALEVVAQHSLVAPPHAITAALKASGAKRPRTGAHDQSVIVKVTVEVVLAPNVSVDVHVNDEVPVK